MPPRVPGLSRALSRLGALRSRWLPLALVTGAMSVLVVVSITVEVQTTRLRHELNDEIRPQATLVDRLQYQVAREMGHLRGFALTGHDRFRRRYEEATQREAQLWQQMRPGAGALGPELAHRVATLESSVAAWHVLVGREARWRKPAVPNGAALQRETAAYEGILDEFAVLSAELDALSTERIIRLDRTETVQTTISLLVALVAVAAAIAATWLTGRMQDIAGEAERRREEVSRLSEGRQRLVRGLTHDVKNPLSVAAGYARLLEQEAAGRLDQRQKDRLLRIGRAIGEAGAMLDDLLELSQAEAGQLPLRPEPSAADVEIGDVAAGERGRFESAGVRLVVVAPGDLPPVTVDRRRFRQILGNLLSNACKYTPHGGRVTVRAGVHAGPGAPGPGRWCVVDVTDTGRGIPPEQQRRIFDEFARFDTDGTPGLGLGLAISRRLAELMGGALTVESQVGRGSTFTLWLPLHPAGADRQPPR